MPQWWKQGSFVKNKKERTIPKFWKFCQILLLLILHFLKSAAEYLDPNLIFKISLFYYSSSNFFLPLLKKEFFLNTSVSESLLKIYSLLIFNKFFLKWLNWVRQYELPIWIKHSIIMITVINILLCMFLWKLLNFYIF